MMPQLADVLFWWALITLLIHVLVSLVLFRGVSLIARLHEVPLDIDAPRTWPRVSILVPARNEARHIREALGSVLNLDYPNYEVIAINDRSTDDTGTILDQFAAVQPRLKVVHIAELPHGWLGKNHALHVAAQQASGEYLLMTDADIVFDPTTLKRTIAYAQLHDIDHLAMTPRVDMPGLLLKSFAVTFTIFFTTYFQPWKAKNPRSRAYIGIGAFNLIRTQVYQAVEGHQRIAMRPDDDVMLGRVIKRAGFRQELVDGSQCMSVPWYGSLNELIRGLEKNAFAGVEYSVGVTVLSSLMALTLNVAPFVLVFVAEGAARWMFATSVAILLCLSSGTARSLQVPLLAALLFPVSVVMFVYIQWRTMILTLWNNGIRWRDTHYSLAELKANRVP